MMRLLRFPRYLTWWTTSKGRSATGVGATRLGCPTDRAGAAAGLAALTLALLAPVLAPPARAQSEAVLAVREYRRAHERAVVDELVELLSLPNVASDTAAMRKNAAALRRMLERRGAAVRFLEVGGPPYVYAELPSPGATRTVLFYCHYDGQPVDTSAWDGHDPWTPILRDGALESGGRKIDWPEERFDRDWRIYARSASDDKAPIVALLAALDGLRSADLDPRVNLKFLFEGDEEIGSPHLPQLARRHGDLLSADLVVAADGPSDPSGRPTLYFGVRGIVTAELTVYGPIRPLHSGHYGNWAPNPAMRLAGLLASMKDPESGRVRIEGFYDDVVPLGAAEREAIAEAPNDDVEQRREFEFAEPEMSGQRLEVINLPSLNVRGLRSGWVGAEARTIVPDRAIASLDLRLVKEVRPGEQIARLRAHIEGQGFHIVEDEPDRSTRLRHPEIVRLRVPSSGYPAFRTPMDLPISRAVVRAIERHTGSSTVKFPTLGGSVPLYVFTDILEIPTVGVPIVNHDNNQHSPNENLRIGHLWDGIETLAAVMRMDRSGGEHGGS